MTENERMALDEAIAHAREVAERNRILADSDRLVQKSYGVNLDTLRCNKCADEHEQLAEWLEELEAYRAIGTVEEFKALKEKSVAKKPSRCEKEYDDFLEHEIVNYYCSCGSKIYTPQLHCEMCGQSIDWSE